MKRFIISYRDEFSAVVEAKTPKAAIKKVRSCPQAYQWECIGELHPDFLSIDNNETFDEAQFFKDISAGPYGQN